MAHIRAKQVLAYAFLPGIVPRIREFASEGFGWLAYLMAMIYGAVRLLPADHPYLRPENRNRYGIHHVIAQAASNLKMTRQHLDQIVIFFTLLAGFVILVVQFVLLVVSMIVKTAWAGGGIFSTPVPDRDIAFILLDKTLGVPGVFNAVPGIPTPFNTALHGLFQFYSLAMLIVAVIVVLYYVLVIVGETAQTGTPFGKRFSHIWAPIRLVVALGLLVPISYGINSGQYITLYAAKLGSGLATNAWILFNMTLTNGLGVDDQTLIARPKIPDTVAITKFMYMVRTCKVAYERSLNNSANSGTTVLTIEPYLIKNPLINQQVAAGSYTTALDFYGNNDIIIRFGATDPNGDLGFAQYVGGVKPYCGEVVIRTNDVTQIGALQVQEGYYNTIFALWNSTRAEDFAQVLTYQWLPNGQQAGCNLSNGGADIDCDTGVKTAFLEQSVQEANLNFETAVVAARAAMLAGTDFTMPVEIIERGWGGAGIWYNRLAQWNGALFSAAYNLPSPNLLPLPMAKVAESRRAADENISGAEYFNPHQSDGKRINFENNDDWNVGIVLHNAYSTWGESGTQLASDVSPKHNIVIDTLNFIFGLNGLFTIRENKDIHPLAQLVGIGKGIIDSTVRNLFAATVFSFGGGLFERIPEFAGLGGFMTLISGLLVSLATIGLTIGFILYYVLPFLPFIYFFFAVGAWLKSVFEAMVGVPLWALAHLKIDGNGLPGDMAISGYFLIFEIFVRPILTVFGLIASIVIFSAMVRVLHEIFPLVTENLTGFDNTAGGGVFLGGTPLEFKRSVIDEFFFTILYTVVVYMLGTASFKMIDLVPKSILRWMGSGVQGFADAQGDPKEGLVQYAAYGGMQMTGQFAQTLQQGSRLVGQTAGTVINNITGGGGPGAGSRTTGGGGTP